MVDGVDYIFYKKAAQDRKPVGELESVEDHLAFMRHFGEGYENNVINQTLNEIDLSSERMSQLKQTWRQGDFNAFSRIYKNSIEKYPKVYDALLFERNNNWMVKIKQMLKTDKIEAVFVGAGHMVGPKGLISQLKQAGYSVTQLP